MSQTIFGFLYGKIIGRLRVKQRRAIGPPCGAKAHRAKAGRSRKCACGEKKITSLHGLILSVIEACTCVSILQVSLRPFTLQSRGKLIAVEWKHST